MTEEYFDGMMERYTATALSRIVRAVTVFAASFMLLSVQPYILAGHGKIALALAALATSGSMSIPVASAMAFLLVLALSPPGAAEFVLQMVR